MIGENTESRKTKKKPLHKVKRVLVNEGRLTGDTSKILGNASNIYGEAAGIDGEVTNIRGNVSNNIFFKIIHRFRLG